MAASASSASSSLPATAVSHDTSSTIFPDDVAKIVAAFITGQNPVSVAGKSVTGGNLFWAAINKVQQSIEKVAPAGVTHEVALAEFVREEVLVGNCERLIRCLDAGLFSVVHDVLFFQGRFRKGVLKQFTAQTVSELFSKSAKNGAPQLLTLLLAQDPFLARLSDNSIGTTLMNSAEYGQSECVHSMLSSSSLIDKVPPLYFGFSMRKAVDNGKLDCLQVFLTLDGLVDRIWDSSFRLALESAATNGHAECLHALLTWEGILDRVTGEELEAVFRAAIENGRVECLHAILANETVVARIPNQELVTATRSSITDSREGVVDAASAY